MEPFGCFGVFSDEPNKGQEAQSTHIHELPGAHFKITISTFGGCAVMPLSCFTCRLQGPAFGAWSVF